MAECGRKVCEQCGESYEAAVSWQRWCSGECRTQWKKEHADQDKKPKRKVCEYCGEWYKPSKIAARRQRFCCEECQRQWWLENRTEAGKVYRYTCQNCGKEYETLYSNRDQYCSHECGCEWRSKQAQVEKDCLSCGEVFEEKSSGPGYCSDECHKRGTRLECSVCGQVFYGRPNAVYCSKECEREQRRQEWTEYKKSIGRNAGRIKTIGCEECGKQFTHEVYNQIPRFCSQKCARKNWRKNNPEKTRTMKAKERRKRRARKYGNGAIDDIDFALLCKRDGWRCGICGEKVNPRLECPHPMSASLDHIVPLARGGTHTWGNVQLAHFICNSKKSFVGGGQLRLGISVEIAGES